MVVKRRKPKPLLIIIIFIGIILLIGTAWLCFLSPVDRSSKADIEVVIPSGTSTREIASILKEKNLIKNEFFFRIYVRVSNANSLKATTYIMKKNMSLSEIVEVLKKGNSYNPDMVQITFKEGQRITDYAKLISTNTNHTYEEVISVMTNKEYIMMLINNYWFLTNDILQDGIYYPLEGYLFPDTYQFENKDVKIETIIEKMLAQMELKLEKYKSEMESNPHNSMTMASIVELEGTTTENRKMIVGVFNNRLSAGMNLGSDVTTYYALQYPMTSDLTTAQFATVNPYNTRSTTMMGKMPIGPICNPSMSSILASLMPSENEYLYFVADKHGEIYYTKTLQEHEKKVSEIKEKGDWIW